MFEILQFSLIIFCFLPMIIAGISLCISVFNFYLLKKIYYKNEIIDDNIVEIMRLNRDSYYKKGD